MFSLLLTKQKKHCKRKKNINEEVEKEGILLIIDRKIKATFRKTL